jgi:hypothetical protein
LLYEQAGGNGTIDAAAHGDYDLIIVLTPGHGVHLLSSVSGCSKRSQRRVTRVKRFEPLERFELLLWNEAIEHNEAHESFQQPASGYFSVTL